MLQRQDDLAEDLEAPVFERVVDARGPLHLAPAPHQVDVVFLEAVDAVAAVFLGRRTSAVRGGQQRGHVLVLRRDRHHADARAEPERALLPDELVVADRFAQRFGVAHRFFERAALQQHAELVAAEPRHGIAPADLRLEQRADLAEQRIAGAVAAVVVDDLELIEIDVAQRERSLARPRALDRALQPRLELAPIHQPGQDVVARVVRELAIQLAALADVVEHQHAAEHIAGAVANGRGAALDVQLVAVAPDQQRRPHALDRARAPDRNRQRILQRLAGLLVEAAEDLVDDAALRVLQAPAGELLRHRVEILDAALGVGRDHAVADRLQRDLRAFLLLEQRVLEELALGDVQVDADDAMGAPLLVDARLRAADDPQPHAVAVPQPVHAFEQRLDAREMIAQRAADALQVVGMDELLPVGQRLDLVVAVAEHRFPARREVRGLAIEVEVPQAVVRAVQRERVALFDLLQVPLVAHALDAGGVAGAEQLQHQVQVRVPAVARQRRAERDEAARAALRREADDQRRADAQRRQLRRLRARDPGAAAKCRGSRSRAGAPADCAGTGTARAARRAACRD